MDRPDPHQHLSQISTLWSVVCAAHAGPDEVMMSARQRLLEQYGGAVHRYLLGALRNQDAAEELAQEFALRFLRGDFHRADPERGKFRSFVKTALFRLVVHYCRHQQKQPAPLHSNVPEPVAPDAEPCTSDEEFAQSWREELLAHAWEALEKAQQTTGQPFYAVLRFRADHPKTSSSEMAELLSAQLGKILSAAGVRQLLHRAREKFADSLLQQVAQSLDKPTAERIEEELCELTLLEYCRPALQRQQPS